MKRSNRGVFVAAVVVGVGLCGSAALAARGLDAAADPTCAVIERADYDAERRVLTLTGRSQTPITLTVVDREGQAPLIQARQEAVGRWTVAFDVVGADAQPLRVEVRSAGGCLAVRPVRSDSWAALYRPGDAG